MPNIKYNTTMAMSDIDTAIGSLSSRSSKIKHDTHKICVSLAFRWNKDKDVTAIAGRATRMVKELDGYHAQALVNWFTHFFGFTWDTSEKVFTYTTTKFDDLPVREKGHTLTEKPYYEFSPAKEPTPYILLDKLDVLLSGALKRAEKGKEGDDIPNSLLNKVSAAMREYKAELSS